MYVRNLSVITSLNWPKSWNRPCRPCRTGRSRRRVRGRGSCQVAPDMIAPRSASAPNDGGGDGHVRRVERARTVRLVGDRRCPKRLLLAALVRGRASGQGGDEGFLRD